MEPSGDGVPADSDDLTIIRSIDDEIQRRLYAAGIFHLDEVARWSRADARRISGAVGVPEETIMHEWIFEAQSVLFDSYQQRMAPAPADGIGA
jgi:predicted flap endonuclease-1-like 5' DNA nuclease